MSEYEDKGGRPYAAIRWTQEMVASEFDADRKTVAKRFRTAGVVPGSDGKFATAQVLEAMLGESPRDAKDRQHTELLRVQTEVLKRERIPLQIPIAANDQAMQAVGATLKAAKGKTLDADLINDLLAQMRAIPAQLDTGKW